jgi:hypothetical protein
MLNAAFGTANAQRSFSAALDSDTSVDPASMVMKVKW